MQGKHAPIPFYVLCILQAGIPLRRVECITNRRDALQQFQHSQVISHWLCEVQ